MYKICHWVFPFVVLGLKGGVMLHESPYVLSMVIVILVYGHCDSSCVCLCVSRVWSAVDKRRGWARHDRVA